jgi:phosphomevalonate decarboxylase
VHEAIPKMLDAIKRKDIASIGELAELDTLLLHGITMTGIDQLFLWRPETVQIILAVKQMRKDGMDCHFSIDTGATVYVNSPLDQTNEVRKILNALGMKTLACHVGDEAKVVQQHLF